MPAARRPASSVRKAASRTGSGRQAALFTTPSLAVPVRLFTPLVSPDLFASLVLLLSPFGAFLARFSTGAHGSFAAFLALF